ncbi:uncharacterized protein EMH_0004020 [Eimeria mitis]|uniref:Uncharacterized protein n=1 Tax=Eimeria mitis TaxID=44415 RepID=U6KG75_9EIME|nr:uncharacterized protein EMH_0004020 [Eimeria mitis]CDJ35262.1 hypothetical protein, conserved [Eimeria mitis]
MTQPGGLSQASVPEACLLRLSTGAKDAPYNEAAALAVEFSITAEKAALGSLQAFCTFLGKVHETGPFSSWPSKEEREGKSAGCCSLPSETLAREENLDSVEECGQAVAVNFELNLTPFSFPATFCEQFIKETLTFTVVRTPDSSQDGSQRKDAQTKASAKPDGREKGGKKAGPPRPIIPPGESRIAEMPVAALLLLKDGERMQPPEGIQEALATTPGVVSLRIEVKAITSLLSPALRHLLNPVWFLIKDARHLPLTAQHLQKPRPQDVSDGTIENLASAGVAAAADGAGVAAAADFVPVASAATPTPENRGTSSETQFRGDSTSEAKYPADVPLEYFARAHMLRTVLETEPRRAMPALGANRVRWDAGFLCFWGPSVENQNELKDFIEERRLEIELVNTYDLSGVDQSNLYPDVAAWQCKGKTMGRPLLKQPKTATVPLGSKVAAEAERLEQQEEEQFRYLSHDNNGEAQMKATVMYEAGVDVLTGFLIADGRQARIPPSEPYFTALHAAPNDRFS